MPTHQGLRYLPVNARALDYQCVYFSVASESGQPLLVSDADALEFLKMTRGVECYVQLPRYIHPALPEADGRNAHRAYFARFLKIAAVLKARAVVVDLPDRWANGKPTSAEEIEDRVVEFFAIEPEAEVPRVYFRIEAGRLGDPNFTERVLARMEPGRFFYALDPTRWHPTGETVNDRQLETILEHWGHRIRLVLFSRFGDDEVGAARRLAPYHPVILVVKSLAEQAEAAERIRALCEEVDVFANL